MGDVKKEGDGFMADASPSPFLMDMDVNMTSALDDLPFTGHKHTVLPQVTKSRFEPKVQGRPQPRGREAQSQLKPALKPEPAEQAPAPPVVKQEPEPENLLAPKPEALLQPIKPEPLQDHGFLDLDFNFPVKADLPPSLEVPELKVEGAQSCCPDVVTKEETDDLADAYPDDGQDRVVREIDVYLRPTLGDPIKVPIVARPEFEPNHRCLYDV